MVQRFEVTKQGPAQVAPWVDRQATVASTTGTPASLDVTLAVPAVSVPVSKDAGEKAGGSGATVRSDIVRKMQGLCLL